MRDARYITNAGIRPVRERRMGATRGRVMVMVLMVSVAAASACALRGYLNLPVDPDSPYAGRPECPVGGEWSALFRNLHGVPGPIAPVTNAGFMNDGQLELSRMPATAAGPAHDGITDIVEFHDCQQFIVRDVATGLPHYSSLFAIFARVFLDSAYKRPPTSSIDSAPAFDPTVMGAPMATIFSYDSSYPALGLSRGFSCLYFFKHTVGVDSVYWSARMVFVHEDQQACARPLLAETGPGTPLAVTRVTVPGLHPSDYPPVARWDRDPSSGLQYIGIRCEDAWCEVHPLMGSGGLFTASAPLRSDVNRVKGWYDEQILTSADTATGVSRSSRTSPGRLFPTRSWPMVGTRSLFPVCGALGRRRDGQHQRKARRLYVEIEPSADGR